MALPPDQPQLGSVFPRYSILPHSDVERCFSIEPEDGTIRTAVPLDREARAWHNLTVLATELGEESWAPGSPGEGSGLLAEGLSLSMGWGREVSCHRVLTSVLGPQCGLSPCGRPVLLGWVGLGMVGLPEHSPDLKFTPIPDFSHPKSKPNLKLLPTPNNPSLHPGRPCLVQSLLQAEARGQERTGTSSDG